MLFRSASISSAQNAANAAQFQSLLSGINIAGVNLGQFITVPNLAGKDQKELLQTLSTLGAQAQAIMQQLIQNAQEADLEKLKAQQDAQLEPIAEKESDIQGKVACNDALTQIWSERKEAAKSKLGEDIKSGLAHYGLNG